MPAQEKLIGNLMDKATDSYSNISDIHKKLLKLGYNKPFSVFLKELKARVVYRNFSKITYI